MAGPHGAGPRQQVGDAALLLVGALLCSCLCACADSADELRPLTDGATILAFGDSLTYGTGAARDQSYPAQLALLTGRRVVNGGVPGELSATGLSRLGVAVSQYQPQLVILCHGGNDILQRRDRGATERNLRAMIETVRASGSEVMMLAVPEPGLLLSASPMYARIAADMQVPYVDSLVPEILADRNLKADPVHPNAAGYRRMAESIHAALRAFGAL